MRLILIVTLFCGCAFGADATTDEADYMEFKAAKEAAAKASFETAKANAESAQLNAEIVLLRKRFPSAKTNAEAFKAWREQLRTQPSNDERWAKTEAVKVGD